MIKMGILTLNPHEKQNYFDGMAEKSNEFNIELFLFSPLSIDPTTQTVKGLYYNRQTQNWENRKFSIPPFLYDRCFYGEDKKSKEAQTIVSWLKTRKDIAFLGYGLPNKWRLYEALKTDPTISPYLPPTKKCMNPEQVIKELKSYNEIILKPINGAHGFAVYSLHLQNKKVIVKTTKQGNLIEKQFDDLNQITQWLKKLLTKQIFIMQPRLDNYNKQKEPFDLRVFLQKDGEGTWHEKARAIRKGKNNGILTNVSAGASIHTFDEWEKTVPHFDHPFLRNELEEVLSTLPNTLEKMFHPLFELGIDIIIGSDQSLWIIDINSKPGRKIVQLTNPSEMETLYTAPLSYCQFLAFSVKEGSKNL